MQASNRPVRTQLTKPRQSETSLDFKQQQQRRRKDQKSVRYERPSWGYGVHEKTNVGARPGRYEGEVLPL